MCILKVNTDWTLINVCIEKEIFSLEGRTTAAHMQAILI